MSLYMIKCNIIIYVINLEVIDDETLCTVMYLQDCFLPVPSEQRTIVIADNFT